jgi:hypothetical protein
MPISVTASLQILNTQIFVGRIRINVGETLENHKAA